MRSCCLVFSQSVRPVSQSGMQVTSQWQGDVPLSVLSAKSLSEAVQSPTGDDPVVDIVESGKES